MLWYGWELRVRRAQYGVSIKVFQHELQSYVDTAPRDTILMTDGFSCKTQSEQRTGREALHIAQVITMAANHAHKLDGSQSYNLGVRRNDGHKREWITAGVGIGFIGIGLLTWKKALLRR
jgi:hypothetical protein